MELTRSRIGARSQKSILIRMWHTRGNATTDFAVPHPPFNDFIGCYDCTYKNVSRVATSKLSGYALLWVRTDYTGYNLGC